MVKSILVFVVTVFTASAFSAELPLAKIVDHSHEMFLVSYSHDKLDMTRDHIMKSMVIDVSNLSKLYVVSSDLKKLGVEFDNLQASLLKAVEAMNEELPADESIDMMFYFFPKKKSALIDAWAKSQHEIKDTPFGTLVVKEVKLNRAKPQVLLNGEVVFPLTDQEYDVYSSISESIDSYNTEMFKAKNREKFGDQSAYLSAVAIQMRLQKNNSAIQVQLLAGMKPGREEKTQEAKEVVINHVLVPQGKAGLSQNGTGGSPGEHSTHPMMLASTEVRQSEEMFDGVVKLKFGAFAGFNTYGETTYEGPLAIADDLLVDQENRKQLGQLSSIAPAVKGDWVKSCKIRQESTPVLKGKFTDSATDTLVDSLLKGKAIEFNIFAIDLIISKEDKVKARLADIRFSTMGLSCVILDKVNEQFLQEIEGTIKDKLNKALKVDDLSQQIALSLDDTWDA